MTKKNSTQKSEKATNVKASRLEAFALAQEKIIGNDRERPTIGTLAEKTVHAVLKNYLEPDEDKQEIPIGQYVADIFTGEEIIEIQTRAMSRMKAKLSVFLPLYPVTIVYPIPAQKLLIWVDPESGELSAPHKSPKKGTMYDAFRELYAIRDYLEDPNLRIRLVLMNMTEYKLLNGRSKDRKHYGAERFDRIPTELVSETELICPEDYMQFVPEDLPDRFTVQDFAKAAHIRQELAGYVVPLLRRLGVLEKVGKAGRQYLYQVTF